MPASFSRQNYIWSTMGRVPTLGNFEPQMNRIDAGWVGWSYGLSGRSAVQFIRMG